MSKGAVAREGLEGLGAECNGARSEATPGKPNHRRHTRHRYPTDKLPLGDAPK